MLPRDAGEASPSSAAVRAGSGTVPLDPDKVNSRYGDAVDRRARQMIEEMDPALRAEVEAFHQWREERQRQRQQQQQHSQQQSPRHSSAANPDSLEQLPREQVAELFGPKVADMVEKVKAHPEREDYKRKLGRYLAAREAEERDKFEDQVVMGDPEHQQNFQRMLAGLQPRVQGPPPKYKDRHEERREVYSRAVSQVDEVLQSQACGHCHRPLLGAHETVGGMKGVDTVLNRFRTCGGCMRSFHAVCREGVLSDAGRPAAPGVEQEAANQWFHSRQCRGMLQAVEQQLRQHISKLPGSRTLEWLKGRRRFLYLEDRITPQQKQSLEDAYEILADGLSPEEAEGALSCDYAMLLRHKGRPCSAAALSLHSPRWVQLMAIATAPACQNKRHAKQLLREVEGVLKGGGVENLAVMWPADDEQAVGICISWLGFQPMSSQQQQDFCLAAGLFDFNSNRRELREMQEAAVFLVKPLQL